MVSAACKVDPPHAEALPWGRGSDGMAANCLQGEDGWERALKGDQNWLARGGLALPGTHLRMEGGWPVNEE